MNKITLIVSMLLIFIGLSSFASAQVHHPVHHRVVHHHRHHRAVHHHPAPHR